MEDHLTDKEQNQNRYFFRDSVNIAGILMLLTGIVTLIEIKFHTGWLIYGSFVVVSMIFLMIGITTSHFRLLGVGSVLLGMGVGSFFLLVFSLDQPLMIMIGWMVLWSGIGWLILLGISSRFAEKIAIWAVLPGLTLIGTGLCPIISNGTILDYVLYVISGLGVGFILWGVVSRQIGLIIPGSILMGIGPGIFYAWSASGEPNSLSRTGIMLVSFTFGWLLITLLSRVIINKFVWWPLIPGGVLAVVGWGLYIGGNPENAQRFVGNTGSISLMIIGLYLLLMRGGIQNR